MKHLRNKKISIFLAISLIVASFSLCRIKKADAAIWPGIDPIISNTLSTIQQNIQGIVMGAAKQAYLNALNSQISVMISGGGSSGSLVISNWNDFLFKQPQAQAQTYLNDYLTQATAGQGSSSFIPNNEGFGNGALAEGLEQDDPAYASLVNTAQAAGINLNNTTAGNYAQQLVNSAKASILPPSSAPQVTYTGDPSQMFASGNFRNMSLYLSGINNPWAFNLNAEQAYQTELQNQQTAAQAQGIAYNGYKGKSVNGQITTPGSTIKDIESSVTNLPNQLVADAQNLPAIMTAVATKMLTQVMTQGIGTIAADINKNGTQVQIRVNQQMNNQVSQYGPGALYQH